jgi:hypothetical protein
MINYKRLRILYNMSQIRRLSDVHTDSIVDTASLISYQQCVLLLLDFNDNIVLGTI